MKLRFSTLLFLLCFFIVSAFAVPAIVMADTTAPLTALVDGVPVPLTAVPTSMPTMTSTTGAAWTPTATATLTQPAAPDITLGWLTDIFKQIAQAFNEGNYAWAAGALLLLGLAVLRKFWDWVPATARVYFASGAAVLGAVSMGLMSGAGVWHSVKMGLTSAAFAALFWNSLAAARKKWPKLDVMLAGHWPFKSKAPEVPAA
jgi:hypothetical protein